LLGGVFFIRGVAWFMHYNSYMTPVDTAPFALIISVLGLVLLFVSTRNGKK
jgi:uncharacterized membrane protein (DUF373 family)